MKRPWVLDDESVRLPYRGKRMTCVDYLMHELQLCVARCSISLTVLSHNNHVDPWEKQYAAETLRMAEKALKYAQEDLRA